MQRSWRILASFNALFLAIGFAQYTPPSGGSGSGSVTSVATSTPISGGTITTTGTVSCPTCGVTGSPLSQFASTTSSQLAGVLSDETGTGNVVFSAAPTLTGNILGSMFYSDASNSRFCTGTAPSTNCYSPFTVHQATNSNLQVDARNLLGSGFTVAAVNDAQNANVGLELRGNPLQLSSFSNSAITIAPVNGVVQATFGQDTSIDWRKSNTKLMTMDAQGSGTLGIRFSGASGTGIVRTATDMVAPSANWGSSDQTIVTESTWYQEGDGSGAYLRVNVGGNSCLPVNSVFGSGVNNTFGLCNERGGNTYAMTGISLALQDHQATTWARSGLYLDPVAETNVGVLKGEVYFGRFAVTPYVGSSSDTLDTSAGNMIHLQPPPFATNGAVNSHALVWTGNSYDGSAHTANWKGFVSNGNNAGTGSSWHLQTWLDGGTPTDSLVVTGSGSTATVGVGTGTNTVYRCAAAGTLPVGALTIDATQCGTTADTGLRVN